MSALIVRQDLFMSRTKGYYTYRIPGLVATRKGTLLAYCEARLGRGGDWDPIDICMRRSFDNGLTWTGPKVVVNHLDFEENEPTNNFVCIVDRINNTVHTLFCQNYARVFTSKSSDDGQSFTAPREITHYFESLREHYPWRVIAIGPGHGIQLSTGRLLASLWMSDGTGTEFGPNRLGHRPSEVGVVYSDDHGETWECSGIVVPNKGPIRNPSESCLAELPDGRVILNTRSESYQHRRLVSLSDDHGTTWSNPEFDDQLLEPICMASMVSDNESHSQDLIFANPGVLERSFQKNASDNRPLLTKKGIPYDRKQLTVRQSKDMGDSWAQSRVLESGPSGYSDLAIQGEDIFCLYECGMNERMYDTKSLRLARFNRDWILATGSMG